MKWFFSYVQVYRDGRLQFGQRIYLDDEHPLACAQRWNDAYGAKEGFQVIVLSFQRVDDSCPETDLLSPGIS